MKKPGVWVLVVVAVAIVVCVFWISRRPVPVVTQPVTKNQGSIEQKKLPIPTPIPKAKQVVATKPPLEKPPVPPVDKGVKKEEKKVIPPKKNGTPPPPPSGVAPPQPDVLLQKLVAIIVSSEMVHEFLQMRLKEAQSAKENPQGYVKELKERAKKEEARFEGDVIRENAARVKQGKQPYSPQFVESVRASNIALAIAAKQQEGAAYLTAKRREEEAKRRMVINARSKTDAQIQIEAYHRWVAQMQVQQGRMQAAPVKNSP